MATTSKATTVYLKPDVHRALRLKSVETSRSMSELINEAVLDALTEDQEDLMVFEERKNEPSISYAEFLKGLKKDGKI